MSEQAEDDDALLADLAESLRVRDDVPPDVLESARAVFTWRTIDEDLATLTFDSLLDEEPSAVRTTSVAPRGLTFAADGILVELEVETGPAQRRLLGQLVPARAAELELVAAGRTVRAAADELGRFVVVLQPEPVHTVLRFTAEDGRRIVAVVGVV